MSGSSGAGPQNCCGAGTGVVCQLAQGSRGHRAFLAGEGDERDPQCTPWLLVSMPDPACKGGCSSCIQHCCNGCGGGELGPGVSGAYAQGLAYPTVVAAVELGHGLGYCLAQAPGRGGPWSVWTESPCVLPGSCLATVSSSCAESVFGWERPQHSQPGTPALASMLIRPLSALARCGVCCLLLLPAAAWLCLALCVRPGSVLLEPLCVRAAPALPSCRVPGCALQGCARLSLSAPRRQGEDVEAALVHPDRQLPLLLRVHNGEWAPCRVSRAGAGRGLDGGVHPTAKPLLGHTRIRSPVASSPWRT